MLDIDDFRTGPYRALPIFSGMDGPKFQEISTLEAVPIRLTWFRQLSPEESPHPMALHIGHNGLSVATGPDVKHKWLAKFDCFSRLEVLQ